MRRKIVYLFIITIVSFFTDTDCHAFEFKGFADVNFDKCDGTPCSEEKGRNGGFRLGTVDLYLSESIENIDILTEIAVLNGAEIHLERLTLGYTFSDSLRLRVGRFHTPISIWNTAYHHGVHLQPTINRPEFLSFEHDSGIIPTHTVGIYLSGIIKTAPLTLEYGIMSGNGERLTKGDKNTVLFPNNNYDNSEDKSVTFKINILPVIVSGLNLGVSAHFDRVKNDNTIATAADVEQAIIGANLAYMLNGLDLMGEYFSIRNRDKIGSAGTNTSDAYYGLISYTFAEKWGPYLLHENMSVKKDDPYFVALGTSNVRKDVVGVRFNINYKSSIKAEYRRVNWDGSDGNEYGVQWTVAF